MASIETVGSFGYTLINDTQGCLGSVFQRDGQSLFFQGCEAGQYPVRQLEIGMGLGTHADFYPGEFLGANFLDNGLDTVVTAGTAVGTDTETSRFQRDVIKHNDDPLRRDIEVSGKLQHTASGPVHVSLGLQQKYFPAIVTYLGVQTLVFQLVYLGAKLVSQDVQSPEACVVAGLFIFLTGITQAHDEPVFTG